MVASAARPGKHASTLRQQRQELVLVVLLEPQEQLVLQELPTLR